MKTGYSQAAGFRIPIQADRKVTPSARQKHWKCKHKVSRRNAGAETHRTQIGSRQQVYVVKCMLLTRLRWPLLPQTLAQVVSGDSVFMGSSSILFFIFKKCA